MKKLKLWKKMVCMTVLAGLMVSFGGCGDKNSTVDNEEPGVANTDESQTSFSIMGGMSALRSEERRVGKEC